jgi:hypothetical protein
MARLTSPSDSGACPSSDTAFVHTPEVSHHEEDDLDPPNHEGELTPMLDHQCA